MTPPADRLPALVERRERAAARAERLAADLAEVHAASRDSNADDEHDPEGATIAFERQQLQALLDRARLDVADAERALARHGTRGEDLCETCGEPVGTERLAVRPTATQCVGCASGGRAEHPR